jgi:mannose-6-phosphate isomerase
VNRQLQPLLDRIVPLNEKGLLQKDQEDFWAARAAGTFNQSGIIDRGIFSIYFFNLVNLKPGETIFQDAGIPHAYLEGQNMELMANSDNVLRGGLTVKHIDVEELMKHVRFEAVVPNIIKGKRGEVEQEEIFPTPAGDFELHELSLKQNDQVQLQAHTAEVFFVYEGAIEVSEGDATLKLRSGEAMLAVANSEFSLKGIDKSTIFRATVPLSN